MRDSVLVIGNGFDLAHSLDTNYNDFIDSAIEYRKRDNPKDIHEERFIILSKKNGFIEHFIKKGKMEKWVDVENDIKIIVSRINEFINRDFKVVGHNGKYQVEISDIFLRERLLDFGIISKDSSQETDRLFFESKYFHKEYGVSKKNIIKRMESELNELIECFEIYLMHIMKKIKIKLIDQIEKINPTYIVTFNYTDTYKEYNFNLRGVFHIHGEVGKNNIVLGIEDDEDEDTDISFLAFKKYFQRIEKKTGFLSEDAFILYQDYHNGIKAYKDVYFYGHSLNITDGDTIKQIRNFSETMYIFYRSDTDDYKNQVKNLIAIFGKNETIDMVQKQKIVFEEIVEQNEGE